MGRQLPELVTLEKLALASLRVGGFVEVLGWAQDEKWELPLLGFSFGSQDPAAPVLGIFGGVHGLERIGAQVALSLLSACCDLLLWDKLLQDALKKVRIIFLPLVNPVGTLHRRRANGAGVDLMRNSPTHSKDRPTFLVGGHRRGPWLPWYRGVENAPMQSEAQALVDFTREQTFASERVITLDFHSGFGVADQIWFPYAHTTKPFPHLPEMHALKEAFEGVHPHHFYKIEQQAKNYTTHGDLWDHLHEEYLRVRPRGVFLPLTIEMGSWMWVKKNPLQLLSTLGPYNPIVPHRLKRILRRHMTLFDFLIRAQFSNEIWVPSHEEQRQKHLTRALELWYGDGV